MGLCNLLWKISVELIWGHGADLETGTLVAPRNDEGICQTPHTSKTEHLYTDTDSFIPYFCILGHFVNRELDWLILNEAKSTEKQKILYINS